MLKDLPSGSKYGWEGIYMLLLQPTENGYALPLQLQFDWKMRGFHYCPYASFGGESIISMECLINLTTRRQRRHWLPLKVMIHGGSPMSRVAWW
jgi:hypothetical protein